MVDRELALILVRVIERHTREGLAEIAALLGGEETTSASDLVAAEMPETRREESQMSATPARRPDAAAIEAATWTKIDQRQAESQRWPDGNIDTYGQFDVYRGSGEFAHLTLALGYADTLGKEGEVVGFVTNPAGTSKRPLTVFFPAKDYSDSHERLSMIRGKGGSGGRKAFAPNDTLPDAYRGMKIASLASRIPGKWNVAAVIAGEGDAGINVMLNHTAIQVAIRGIA